MRIKPLIATWSDRRKVADRLTEEEEQEDAHMKCSTCISSRPPWQLIFVGMRGCVDGDCWARQNVKGNVEPTFWDITAAQAPVQSSDFTTMTAKWRMLSNKEVWADRFSLDTCYKRQWRMLINTLTPERCDRRSTLQYEYVWGNALHLFENRSTHYLTRDSLASKESRENAGPFIRRERKVGTLQTGTAKSNELQKWLLEEPAYISIRPPAKSQKHWDK